MKWNRTDSIWNGRPAPSNPTFSGLHAIGRETRIDTDFGTIPAGRLTESHRLRVLGRGFVAVNWIELLELDTEILGEFAELRPICIRAGSLLPGVPRRDLVVTPDTLICAGGHETLAGRFGAARMFTGGEREAMIDRKPVAYVVIGCARPLMFRAEGMWVSC